MRYLLDTHTFAWAVGAPEQLSAAVTQVLRDPGNTLVVSAASIWEMSIKHHLGKWPEVAPFLDDAQLRQFLLTLQATDLPIQHSHARVAGAWKIDHRDPFDRVLAAQSMLEGVPILSRDPLLDHFPITRIW